MKAELTGKLNKEKMMCLNCSIGENCWEYHGLQEKPDEVKTDNSLGTIIMKLQLKYFEYLMLIEEYQRKHGCLEKLKATEKRPTENKEIKNHHGRHKYEITKTERSSY